MNIETLHLKCSGYIECRSKFYTAYDIISKNDGFTFVKGLNMLNDDIDSGIWAASYILSMFCEKREAFVMFDNAIVIVNNSPVELEDILKLSCYMDDIYSLFSSKKTVDELLKEGISTSNSHYTIEELKIMFCLSDDRCRRTISQTGNESFRAMAAIGLAYNKEIFCFPWLSRKRFERFESNLTFTIEKLSELEKMIILPIGK